MRHPPTNILMAIFAVMMMGEGFSMAGEPAAKVTSRASAAKASRSSSACRPSTRSARRAGSRRA